MLWIIRKHLFNRQIRTLLYSHSLVKVAGGLLAPIYALFVSSVGGSLLDASLTAGVFALVAGATTLIAGKYTDRTQHSRTIVFWGFIVVGIGYFLYSQVNSLISLLAVQVLMGLADAFYSPAYDALYSANITREKAGREWSAWEAMNYFTLGIGSLIGGLIVTYFGFPTMFYLMAGLCFIGALLLIRNLIDKP